MSRRIVVDASVARSAGETSHPDSVLCREFLLAILKICHRVVLTPEIEREWRRHASRFSLRWLASMRSRRKVVDVSPTITLASLLDGSRDLAGRRLDAVEKDCLLVDAAPRLRRAHRVAGRQNARNLTNSRTRYRAAAGARVGEPGGR